MFQSVMLLFFQKQLHCSPLFPDGFDEEVSNQNSNTRTKINNDKSVNLHYYAHDSNLIIII